MFALYKDTAVLAFKRAAAGWLVAVALVFYVVVFLLAYRVVAGLGLGIVGGFMLGLLMSACLSGYFYFLSQAVQGLKLRFDDFKRGFGVLFWDVVSVMFALWILGFVADMVVSGAGPSNGPAIAIMISLAMAFFFNPMPEMIYLGSSRSFELLMQSARFVLANPVAWFLPNLILAALFLLPSGALSVNHPGELLVVFSELFGLGVINYFSRLPPWSWALMLLFVHWAMVFRGLLFQALSSGNNARRRQWQASQRA